MGVLALLEAAEGRSYCIVYKIGKGCSQGHASHGMHDAGPSGVHLGALDLLVKAWVWGWSPFMEKNKARAQDRG